MDVSRMIVQSLYNDNLQKSLELTRALSKRIHAVKVHALRDRYESYLFLALFRTGAPRIFCDYKISDAPSVAAERVRALVDQGANMITVYASGGVRMMEAVVKAAGKAEILAVTVPTWLTDAEVRKTYRESPRAAVIKFARDAVEAGVHGVVASGREASVLSRWYPVKKRGLSIYVTGIRSSARNLGDQKRWVTATEAVQNGATRIILGSEVTGAHDPIVSFASIEREIKEAVHGNSRHA